MWFCRQIIKISSVDHVSNKRVLQMLQKETEIMHTQTKILLLYIEEPKVPTPVNSPGKVLGKCEICFYRFSKGCLGQQPVKIKII